MRKPTIIAMGGGGFSMEPDNPLLDDYVLSLTGKERPSVCFVPTASGDAEGYIERFHAAFTERADTAVLQLFRRSVADLAAFIARQDVVYVGGGNTANMLAVWRVHGFEAVLRSAWQRGTILCGLSAGALCWFEGGVTDSFGEGLAPLRDGLGLLPGSFCPHYDGEPLRRPAYERLVLQGELPGGWAADDGVALHFEGTELVSVVASSADAAAWRLHAGNGEQLSVQRLQPLFLGATSPQDDEAEIA
ncbi:Type 1 glutamine amidotransferase-like domain-containing protein [Vulgatibacter sp.]|uniref:Type 1 glutamine amidotransferase-like domain-containing protein n=1 Tax=Vulgatibacter sp. TaxID=1971226 RepID=UPI00356180C1